MCEDPIHINNSMTHESQDLLVPEEEEFTLPTEEHARPVGDGVLQQQDGPVSAFNPDRMTLQGPVSFNPDKLTQGPVNAITVLTLLDKLVNMLDTVQENQHKMEVRQDDMGGVVRGIQADMTKLSKNHSHTSNTVSKLLDKSRKVSVTMKEVRDKMERQAGQVKKLEANHAHLLKRNNFKVLIFQDENEIPSSVFVKEPVPYPRDNLEVGGDDLSLVVPAMMDTNRSQEEDGLHTIDLSSDEDVGLEAELEEEGEDLQDLEHMDKTRAHKIKSSSLKRVDSIKKAFSRVNIEKKMTKLGTKMVSQEQRDKIKKSFSHQQKSPGEKRTSPFKVSPLSFSIRKRGGSTSSEPVVAADPEASLQTGDSPAGEAQIQLSPLGSPDPDIPFTQVHSELAPPTAAAAATDAPPTAAAADDAPPTAAADDDIPPTTAAAEKLAPDVADDVPECDDFPEAPEGVSEEYALSETLPQGEEPPPPQEEEEEEESHVAPPHQEVEEDEEVEKEVEEEEKEEEKEKGEKEGMKGEMKVEEKEREEGVST